MCFALQDPGAWSDVASFDLSDTATPPRHNLAGYTTLLQERTMDNSMDYTLNTPTAISGRDKNCASFGLGSVTSLTPINSSKPSQASTGRRRRRERGEPSPLCDRTCSSFLENNSNSPKKTPTKSLPFTPSRVNEICYFFLFTHKNPHLSWLLCVCIGHVTDPPCVVVPSSATYQGQNIWIWITLPSPQLLCAAKGVSCTRRSTKKPHLSTRRRMMGK